MTREEKDAWLGRYKLAQAVYEKETDPVALDEIQNVRLDIIDAIQDLDDDRAKAMLYMRYIQRQTTDEIAKALDIGTRYCTAQINQALDDLEVD